MRRLSLSIASFLLLMGLPPRQPSAPLRPWIRLVLAIEGRQSALVHVEPGSSLDPAS
jgi:hypothetical protein